jgi:hypothetical protein
MSSLSSRRGTWSDPADVGCWKAVGVGCTFRSILIIVGSCRSTFPDHIVLVIVKKDSKLLKTRYAAFYCTLGLQPFLILLGKPVKWHFEDEYLFV